MYVSFFTIASAGQDNFKQSTTRLYYVADKIVAMILDMHKILSVWWRISLRPAWGMCATASPHTSMVFVTGCAEVVLKLTKDDDAVDAFKWSLGLVSGMLTRVINEASPTVMKAISTNSDHS